MREKSSWNSVGAIDGGGETTPVNLERPSGMPIAATIRMPITVPPITLRKFSAAISTKPRRHSTGGQLLRSPSVTSVAGCATTILASSSAMIARNRPTPAEIASFRFFGIASMMYSRTRNSDSAKNSAPEQNTAASACCHEYL